jgi:GrpB-like predicted nucleotidyltransferase (UPF0157 family)
MREDDALGLEPDVVRLVEYDDRWPALFLAERERLLERCGTLRLRFEHVGGTSIPGLCSKPVLDIAAGRHGETAIGDCVAAFEQAGYDHRGERGVPGREFFGRGRPRAYHLHLVEADGPLWHHYLQFRDYLRTHPDAARRFADLKRTLAARFHDDREAYLEAKSPHVQEILRLAGSGTTLVNV